MDRRQFLRNSAIVAAGAIAADQLELIEKLGWKRKFFSGYSESILVFDPTLVVDIESRNIDSSAHIIYGRGRTSWSTAPVAAEMELATYRRRYGLYGHNLAFRKDGSWLISPITS